MEASLCEPFPRTISTHKKTSFQVENLHKTINFEVARYENY